MESERPIEKLLRAFAKKRRDQSGAPFELGAEARRRLLREVQKQHDEPEEDRGFFRLVIPLPRLAFVLSVVAIIAVLGAMLLPALSKAKSKAKRTSALAQRRQVELEAQMAREELAAPAAPAAAPVATAAPAPVAADQYLGDIRVTNAVSPNIFGNGALAVNRSLDGLNKKDMSFDGGAHTDTTLAVNSPSNMLSHSLGITARPTISAASAPASWSAAASYSDVAGYPESTNLSARYYRLRAIQDSPTQALSPVLAAFELRVSGTNVRVVDKDGSLYEGALKPESRLTVSAGQTTLTVVDDKPSTGSLGGEFSFEVAGTNRTLNQPIVFAGKLMAPTNAAVRSMPATTAARQPPAAATESWPGKLDISGILTIDGKQTEIQAAPVAP